MKKQAVVFVIVTILLFLTGCIQNEDTITAESNSMNPGIKKGDELVYTEISNKSDITTWMQGKDSGYKKFENYGDVIVYFPYGSEKRDQIIHRAICWVDLQENESQITYSVEGYGIFHEDSITIDELGLENYEPENEGFITKGDNNDVADQGITGLNSICSEPVKVDWIKGKIVEIK